MADRSNTSLSLLQRIRGGDGTAWDRVVGLYTPLVRHWCRRWGVQSPDADDLAQEVFHAASTSIGNFQRDRPGDTFRGWLRGITRHKLLAFWRERGPGPAAVGGSEALQRLQDHPDTEAPEDAEDGDEVSALFQRALGLLRAEFEPRTWQAFWRVAVDGLSAVEVAAETGMTASAIRMSKSRILHRLREELGDLVE